MVLKIITASLCFFKLLSMLLQDSVERMDKVVMDKEKKEKVKVNIQYPCFICAINENFGVKQVIDHIQNTHGYILSPRQSDHGGDRLSTSNCSSLEDDIKQKWDVQHFGCPSCLFHCPRELEMLLDHIMIEHKPTKIEGFFAREEYADDVVEGSGSGENEEDDRSQGTTTAEDIGESKTSGEEGERKASYSNSVSTSSVKSDDQDKTMPPVVTASVSEEENIKEEASVTTSATSSNETQFFSAPTTAARRSRKYDHLSNDELIQGVIQRLDNLNSIFKQELVKSKNQHYR